MSRVSVTWLGHSCFAVEEDGFRIIFDPYADGSVPGLPPLRAQADLVLCSHDHGDHNAKDLITIRRDAAKKQNPFAVTFLDSFHDDVHGAKRGRNRMTILSDGQYKIVHMGDIGCIPEKEQIDALFGADVVMVPVGGFFTLPPAEIYALMQEISPKTVIPMHYRRGKAGEKGAFGYDVIGTACDYTKLCSPGSVRVLPGNTFRLPEDQRGEMQTAVLTLKI